jgi:hypothetical protein
VRGSAGQPDAEVGFAGAWWWSTAETGQLPQPATDVDSYIATYPDLIDLATILAHSHRPIVNTDRLCQTAHARSMTSTPTYQAVPGQN